MSDFSVSPHGLAHITHNENTHHNVIPLRDSVGGRIWLVPPLSLRGLFIITMIFQGCQCVCHWNGPDGMRNRPGCVTVMPTATVNNPPRKHSLCKHFEVLGASMETSIPSGCLEFRLTWKKQVLVIILFCLKFSPCIIAVKAVTHVTTTISMLS